MSVKEKRRLSETPTRDLVNGWADEVPPDEYELLKARAKEAGMTLSEFVTAEMAGKPTEKPLPFVQFARSGTMEGVASECREFLKRVDVLEYIEMPTALVVSVLKRLVETDSTISDMGRDEFEILKSVRDTWERRYFKQRRKG